MRTLGGIWVWGAMMGATAMGVCGLAVAAPPGMNQVKTGAGTLTLPTYGWHDDVNPAFAEYEGSIYYPYTRQDLIDFRKQDRTYRTLWLENEYLRVTCLPELGGRIHSVFDKTTNTEMFHKNDEIKPALIAMRGAWISGGIEWNVGPQGHTVTIVSPVDAAVLSNPDGSATLVVGNTEKMFRTRWTVRLTLHPGKAFLDETICIANPTDGVHPFYFWNCTAFPNLEGTRFVYPMTLGTDHNGTEFYRWPIHEGKDLSQLKNYETMSSIFGYKCDFDFFGAYDSGLDRGIVSYANHFELPGKKAWTWGKDDFGVVSQMALCDAGPVHAQYIEVQSGPLLTQSDYGMLEPHQEVSWREFWYPVHGLGDGFEFATRDAAAQVKRADGALEVRLLATGAYPGAACLLTKDGTTLIEQKLDLSPSEAAAVRLEPAPDGPITVEVRASDGAVLLRYETPLAIPAVEPPDLTTHPARPDAQPTADEKYHEGFLADSQSNPAGARAGYDAALGIDPLHAPSLRGLAALDLEEGRYDTAVEHAEKALLRDSGNGLAWYFLGAARLKQDRPEEALAAGYHAVRSLEYVALGYNLVGRALMRLGRAGDAMEAFGKSREHNGNDAANRDGCIAARYASGQRQQAAREAAAIASHEDPTDFVLAAIAALDGPELMPAFVAALLTMSGEVEFNLIGTALFFEDLGMTDTAIRVMNAGLEGTAAQRMGPLSRLYLAWFLHRAGRVDEAGAWVDEAAAMPSDHVFPAGPDAVAALQFAIGVPPDDAHLHLYLAQTLCGLRRADEALPHWEKAVEIDPTLSVGWRALAMHALKKLGDKVRAETCLRKALEARPDDQIVRRDLATLLTDLERRPEAIQVVEAMPEVPTPRYDLLLWLAGAYVAEKRYDDCVRLLETAEFSNWEASTQPRDIFVSALLARGKLRFESADFESARADFDRALTYPENLHVGARYKRTDAEVCYWLGKTLQELGKPEEARKAFEDGAAQVSKQDPPLPFITVTEAQDEHVALCAKALEGLAK